MEVVKRKNEKACVYLDKWPRESWTKAYLSENCKVDNITNNNCESFNAKILKFRNKPILSLCEDIRTYIMRKMTSANLKMAARLGPLVPMNSQGQKRRNLNPTSGLQTGLMILMELDLRYAIMKQELMSIYVRGWQVHRIAQVV